MMISNLAQITAAWLADVLALPAASVISIEQSPNDAFNSSVGHLTINYSADSPADAPTRLLLKLNADENGFEEVKFYRAVMALLNREQLSVVPRCYAADMDSTSGHSYCLLQDLSETHQAPVTRDQLIAGDSVPRAQDLETIIQTIAQFHAFWWQHSLLGRDMAQVRWWYTNEDAFVKHVERRQHEWAKFKANVDSWFPADLIALYERLLTQLPGLWDVYLKDRVLTFRHITLSEGDCYLSQFLCPKSYASDDHGYLIDFQDVSANFPTYDLVYMVPAFWNSQQRAEANREENFLRRYLYWLHEFGITDYSWDELYLDYQMMIAVMLFDPIWNQVSGSAESYWWPKMQRLIAAFKDHKCAEVLDQTLPQQ